MYGLIDDIWEEHAELLTGIAENLRIVAEAPSDKLLVIYVASKCGAIQIESPNSKYVDDMMAKVVETGRIEGNVETAMNDPDFIKECW